MFIFRGLNSSCLCRPLRDLMIAGIKSVRSPFGAGESFSHVLWKIDRPPCSEGLLFEVAANFLTGGERPPVSLFWGHPTHTPADIAGGRRLQAPDDGQGPGTPKLGTPRSSLAGHRPRCPVAPVVFPPFFWGGKTPPFNLNQTEKDALVFPMATGHLSR